MLPTVRPPLVVSLCLRRGCTQSRRQPCAHHLLSTHDGLPTWSRSGFVLRNLPPNPFRSCNRTRTRTRCCSRDSTPAPRRSPTAHRKRLGSWRRCLECPPVSVVCRIRAEIRIRTFRTKGLHQTRNKHLLIRYGTRRTRTNLGSRLCRSRRYFWCRSTHGVPFFRVLFGKAGA